MNTIEIILASLAGIFGAGWGWQFAYYRIERRKRNAEVESAELDVDAKHHLMKDQSLDHAYKQIETLQGIVDTERRKWVNLAKELSNIKIELMAEQERRKIAEYNKCSREGCEQRIPPRGQQADEKQL